MWIERDRRRNAYGRLFRGRVVAALGCVASTLAAVPAGAALVDLGNVAAIAVGGQHSCALTRAGAAKCWGWNAEGQVGDGTTVSRTTPVGVAGLSLGVAALVAGEAHACALTNAGAVRCWGSNEHGQLGNGATTASLVPVDVAGLSGGIVAIAAGAYHACALTDASGVKCWGRAGTVGNATHEASTVPVDVLGLETGAAAISAGGFHTCALTKAGAVKCWGLNVDGQLGDGSTVDRTTPTAVAGLPTGIAGIAAGSWHTCAITAAGGAKCWGNNSYGQLGDGSPPASRVLSPVDVAGLASGVASLSGGYGHSCAVLSAGGGRCWGANEAGQLGDGSTAPRLVPVDVTGLASGVATIAGGQYHTCALSSTGGVMCWGSNDGGQLGDDGNADRGSALPVRIATYDLTVATTGTVAGRVSAPGVGIECGAACSATATAGDAVALVAIPPAEGYLAGWGGACSGIGACTVVMDAAKAVTATFDPRSLVRHYYRAILRREADAAGDAYWNAEAARLKALGASVNEAWYAMAQSFYFSPEYLAFGRGDGDFVTDLYNTFFYRPPDAQGLAYWTGQLASGLPREGALVSFMFSAEFRGVLQSVFGATAVRPEIDTVTDFYRGMLARLPDDGGFAYWLARFRAAQCRGGAAVNAEVEAISSLFTGSAEYAARGRTNAQYVGDLYNAFLRRGGDLPGVLYWIAELDKKARTRDNVRRAFVASPEFQARVAAIIAQGCLPG